MEEEEEEEEEKEVEEEEPRFRTKSASLSYSKLTVAMADDIASVRARYCSLDRCCCLSRTPASEPLIPLLATYPVDQRPKKTNS